jgi:GT2 family glycosyltransferase
VIITAILASHNRRARTLACLASFYGQEVEPGVALSAVLVDDGSSDGTADAVRARFPSMRVVLGDGNLYWAAAMARAEQVALEGDPDYLLWLNDDVELDPDALSRLLHLASDRADAGIVVGALRDPATGDLTYSGVRRRGLHPLRFDRVQPGHEPVDIPTFNGNVVLVPRSSALKIGSIDGEFAHAIADIDYGLRASRLGVASVLAPGTLGTCRRDATAAPWLDRTNPLLKRLRLLFGRNGIPPRSTARFLRRHGGRLWMTYWLISYVKAALGAVSLTLRRQ